MPSASGTMWDMLDRKDKRAYCCTASGLGCTTQMPLEGQMFDCTQGVQQGFRWLQASHRIRSDSVLYCRRQPLLHFLSEGYANWPEWPANKQSWCCVKLSWDLATVVLRAVSISLSCLMLHGRRASLTRVSLTEHAAV